MSVTDWILQEDTLTLAELRELALADLVPGMLRVHSEDEAATGAIDQLLSELVSEVNGAGSGNKSPYPLTVDGSGPEFGVNLRDPASPSDRVRLYIRSQYGSPDYSLKVKVVGRHDNLALYEGTGTAVECMATAIVRHAFVTVLDAWLQRAAVYAGTHYANVPFHQDLTRIVDGTDTSGSAPNSSPAAS